MSKEYIEKEAAINYLTLNMCWYDEEGGQVEDWDERKAIISDLLDGIPPADVKPTICGEWEEIKRGGIFNKYILYRCNHCGNTFKVYEDTLNAGRGDKRFCPNCGADMRKEANDER